MMKLFKNWLFDTTIVNEQTPNNDINVEKFICLNEKGNDFDAIEDDCLIASSAAISSELLKNL